MCFGKGDPNSKQGAPSGDNGSSPSYSSSSVASRSKDRDTKSQTLVTSSRPRARTDVRTNERSLGARMFSSVKQSLFRRG